MIQFCTTQRPATATPVLQVGAGFSGATATPSFDPGLAIPAAQWINEQNEDMTAEHWIGVLAFDPTGINRVEFSASDGSWASVGRRTYHADPHGKYAWAHWARLPASTADSATPVEIRAIAYATSGAARVLQDTSGSDSLDKSLYVYPNVGGTLLNSAVAVYVDSASGNDTYNADKINNAASPFLTIFAAASAITTYSGSNAGGTVWVQEGTGYVCKATGPSTGRPVKIKRATAAVKANTVVGGAAGSGSKILGRVRVSGLTVTPADSSYTLFYGDANSSAVNLIVEDCDIIGLGRDTTSDPATALFGNFGSTTSEIHFVGCAASAMQGWMSFPVMRAKNCAYTASSGDIYNVKQVLNCSVDDHNQTGSQHADTYQVFGASTQDNRIVCNLRETNTAVTVLSLGDGSGGTIQNSAYVNIDIAASEALSRISNTFTGCTFAFWTLSGQSLSHTQYCLGDGSSVIKGCVLQSLISAADNEAQFAAKFNVDDCHLISTAAALGTTIGTNVTSGAAGWDAARLPDAGGNLAARIANTDPLWIEFDVENNARATPTAVGANIGDDEV